MTTRRYEEEHALVAVTGKNALPSNVEARVAKLRKQHPSSPLDLLAVGGVNGRVRLWCVDPVSGAGECVWKEGESQEEVDRDAKLGKAQPLIESLHWSPESGLLGCASSNQCIVFYDLHNPKSKVRLFV